MAKIGLIQVDNFMSNDIKARQDSLIDLGEACLKEGADLIFFPEAFQYAKDRSILEDKSRLSETATLWKKRCSALAKKYGAYVVPWDYRLDGEGRVFNVSYILDREGNEIGEYRKCNLTVGEISKGISKGEDYPVFDLDFGRIGILICFDNYFPESAAILGSRGARLVLYPLYGDTLKPQWEMKLRTRAIDHTLYMASCQLDPYFDIAYTGIVDPLGEVVEKLDSINSYRVVEVDMDVEVRTNTLAIEGRSENIREYLHKCRNYKAYSGILEEGTLPLEWDEIIRTK